MAEENHTTNDDAPASLAPAIEPAKKQRKARAKKMAPETASANVAAEAAPTLNSNPGKRGKQIREPKTRSSEDAISAKSAPVSRTRKLLKATNAAPAVVIDEMADLLQLDEENQRLRKLLAEKLHAENADLRKRLNLG